MNRMKVCLCGGGAQTHVIAAWLSSQGCPTSILTRRPNEWNANYSVSTDSGEMIALIDKISDNPADVIPDADVILLTVPGGANGKELEKIRPYLKSGSYVGGVFCSSGFFFEALKILPPDVKLWGFQRVPFIARIEEYGHKAILKSTRPQLKVAVERASDEEKESLRAWIEKYFGSETVLLANYLEASITNSNPILHTARLYTMFSGWEPSQVYSHNILFYEEWTEEAADLLIKMDRELFLLLEHLPVTPGYLMPLLDYYESSDAKSLAKKISSISGFKGITSPMKKVDSGWIPDFTSRYFTEDFGLSLYYIYELAQKHGVSVPNIEKVLMWGREKISIQGTDADNVNQQACESPSGHGLPAE